MAIPRVISRMYCADVRMASPFGKVFGLWSAFTEKTEQLKCKMAARGIGVLTPSVTMTRTTRRCSEMQIKLTTDEFEVAILTGGVLVVAAGSIASLQWKRRRG